MASDVPEYVFCNGEEIEWTYGHENVSRFRQYFENLDAALEAQGLNEKNRTWFKEQVSGSH